MTNTRQQRRTGARRGATLVLVAVMVLVAGGMAALAIDFARVYSGVTEMQTAADAAALAGAHRLQRNAGANATSAVQTFATANAAFGTATSLATGDVEGGIFTPSTSTFTAGAWTSANAVRVTVNRTTNGGFARLLGLAQLSPRRRAVAWIGNQATQDCIKPWGMQTSYLNTLLGTSITTQAGIDLVRANNTTNAPAGQYAMTVVAGPDITNPRGSPNTPPSVFLALTGQNSSRKQYENAIVGQSCDGTADYGVGTAETRIQTQPGQGNGDIPRTTANAVEGNVNGNVQNIVQTCKPQTNFRDATCYDPVTNAAGVTVTVAAVTSVGVNSANINMLMGFKLMCVFRGGNGNQPGSSSAQEVCPWLTAAGRTDNNFTQGTLVGYPMPVQAVTGAGNSLGNTLSLNQKLVLVQ